MRLAFLILCTALALLSEAQATDNRNLAVSVTAPTASEHKVALVIGNSRYKDQPLKNPGNDARAIANKLKSLGFDVVLRENLTVAQIGRVLREFRTKIKPGAVALFFYAGHGLQVKGVNFLPAVDAEIEGEEDVPRSSLNVNEVLGLLEEAKTRLNLVFLDACRNNPYARSFRSTAGGLAKVEAPSGTLISFATRPGSVAADGDSANGLYTEQLLKSIDDPGIPVEQVLKRVTSGVKQRSQGKQEPWMEGSIEGDFYFVPREEMNAIATQRSPDSQQMAIDRAVAEAVKRTSEQAARERADLQASMERILKDALARQNAALAVERARREKENTESPGPRKPGKDTAPLTSTSNPQPHSIVATAAPTLAVPTVLAPLKEVGGLADMAGDEWEYAANDEIFHKHQKLTLRVKAVSADGSLEEILWNGRPSLEWVFGPYATVIGTPNESEFMFGPHWDGKELSEMTVEGGKGLCTASGWSCQIRLKQIGQELLTTPAGTFDATRLEGYITGSSSRMMSVTGKVVVWYSREQRRLLKQFAEAYGNRFRFKETLVLSAIRRVAR